MIVWPKIYQKAKQEAMPYIFYGVLWMELAYYKAFKPCAWSHLSQLPTLYALYDGSTKMSEIITDISIKRAESTHYDQGHL